MVAVAPLEKQSRTKMGERIEEHTIVRKSFGVVKRESKECIERERECGGKERKSLFSFRSCCKERGGVG